MPQEAPKSPSSIKGEDTTSQWVSLKRLIDLKRVYNKGIVEVKNKKLSGEIKVLRFNQFPRGLKPIFKSPTF